MRITIFKKNMSGILGLTTDRTMIPEDKQLLLHDLCARLPYGVILSVGIFDNGDMKYHNKKLDCHSNLLSVIELDGGYYFNGLLWFFRFSSWSGRI